MTPNEEMHKCISVTLQKALIECLLYTSTEE